MILTDAHVHTSLSSDSSTPMVQMAAQARNLHLEAICFTEHMDYDFPKTPMNQDFTFSPDAYMEELERTRTEFPDICIRQGIELGLKPGLAARYQTLLSEYSFDFVIGSTHLVHNMDPYYKEYWEGFSEKQGILDYYDTTLNNILSGTNFDVYGHIDYILRYTPTVKRLQEQGTDVEPFLTQCLAQSRDCIDEILRQLLSQGRGIELNTSGLKYGLGHAHPHEWILKRYRELGGEIITVGSDAHEPAHLGYGFDTVPHILCNCGFTHYTVFEGRRPHFIPL